MIKNVLPVLFACLALTGFSQGNVDNTDVTHYDINITNLDFENHSMQAHTSLDFTLHETASQVYLHLQNLTVDSVVSQTENLGFSHNDTILSIQLGETLNPGENKEITVFYHGNPQTDPSGWGGFYFSNNYAFNLGVGFEDIPHNYGRVWFPCVDNFTDRANYTFHITTSTENKAACNGLLDSIQTQINGNDTSLIHHWTLSDAIPTYLASMAVGPYEIIEYSYQGIERDIPVQLFVFDGNTNNALGSFQNLDSILAAFEDAFGPYPWQRVGYVAVPFNSGAMEHPTNIAIGNGFINGDLTYESLIAHELSHSWFGDYITCHEAGEMWINEGWATYSETIYNEYLYGINTARNYRRNSHKTTLLTAQKDDGDFYPLSDIPLEVTYGTTSYEKGADVVHSLRAYLGEDFFPAVQHMLSQKALDDITSEEMRDILSDYSGTDLSEFFNSWVFDKGYPHYKIDSFSVSNTGTEYDVEVFVRQQAYGRDNLYDDNRIDICFMHDDFSVVEKRMEFDGEYGSHTFTLDFNPKFVMLDYFERWSDARTSKAKFISSTGTSLFTDALFKADILSVSDSVFMRMSHHWAEPDTITKPEPGIILADHRYWKLEGDFPDDFSAKGEFSFSNTSSGSMPNLDTHFITNSLDSLKIAWRANPDDEWQIPENQSTSAFIKRITLDNLQAGEYRLAIYDWDAWHSMDDKKSEKLVSIYPNPSNSKLTIQIDKSLVSGSYTIVNSMGRIMEQGKISPDKNTILWEAPASGMYFIRIETRTGQSETQKIMIN